MVWGAVQTHHPPPPLPGNIHAQVSVGHATSNTAGTCPELQRTTDGQHLMIRNPLVCFNLASGRHATSTPPPPPPQLTYRRPGCDLFFAHGVTQSSGSLAGTA